MDVEKKSSKIRLD